MSFEQFFSPFFLFWGSDLLSFIIEMLLPSVILFTFIRSIFGGFFNV